MQQKLLSVNDIVSFPFELHLHVVLFLVILYCFVFTGLTNGTSLIGGNLGMENRKWFLIDYLSV